MVLDARFHYAESVRQVVALAAYPIQRVAMAPVDLFNGVVGYFSSTAALRAENAALRAQQLRQAPELLQLETLKDENIQLRHLLDARERLTRKAVFAEILYAARDPFSRKVVIDKGSQNGILAGEPVIDDVGVIGQVTRVYLLMSEVTLLSDKDQAIPLQVLRNGLRAAPELLQLQALKEENNQLRRLLDAQERLPRKSTFAEILYAARDPFSRKVVIDKGSQNGILPGQPVIDDVGVIGQVTRVYLLMSEVTLLSDKDQAIPLQVLRNGLRAVAYGGAEGGMFDLRFMAANADIKNGDILVTSGIDGTYPPGLPVATVARIERDAAYAFARISLAPTAGTDRYRQVLVLSNESKPPPPQEEQPLRKSPKSKRQRKAE
jgi:cell shape-determining protein MreC